MRRFFKSALKIFVSLSTAIAAQPNTNESKPNQTETVATCCIYGAEKSNSSAPNMTMHRLNTTAKSFYQRATNTLTLRASYSLLLLVFGSVFLFCMCHWRRVMMHFHHLPLRSFVLRASFFSPDIFIVVYASFIKIDSQSQLRGLKKQYVVHSAYTGTQSHINDGTHTTAIRIDIACVYMNIDYHKFFTTINSRGCDTLESVCQIKEWDKRAFDPVISNR